MHGLKLNFRISWLNKQARSAAAVAEKHVTSVPLVIIPCKTKIALRRIGKASLTIGDWRLIR
jgi:hypothetical protein